MSKSKSNSKSKTKSKFKSKSKSKSNLSVRLYSVSSKYGAWHWWQTVLYLSKLDNGSGQLFGQWVLQNKQTTAWELLLSCSEHQCLCVKYVNGEYAAAMPGPPDQLCWRHTMGSFLLVFDKLEVITRPVSRQRFPCIAAQCCLVPSRPEKWQPLLGIAPDTFQSDMRVTLDNVV